MDSGTINEIIDLYSKEFSLRQIEETIHHKYGREAIRRALKKSGVMLRGIGMRYKDFKEFNEKERVIFAELLGYFYGDGSLCKESKSNFYQCCLFFSLNEKDLVERVVNITRILFYFTPKVYKTKSLYIIRFKRNFAKYLYKIGYPLGKKSVLNPNIPLKILKTNLMKSGFICGFFNAEATINRTLSVQQSVRSNLPKKTIKKIKRSNEVYMLHKQSCYLIRWGKVKDLLKEEIIEKSNILLGIKYLLENFKIRSTIYTVRLYIGKEDKTSIHYELQINPKDLIKIKKLNMLSCIKKTDRLNILLTQR